MMQIAAHLRKPPLGFCAQLSQDCPVFPKIKNIEFTYAAEHSMSGQVGVPADLKEMFEEMVESLALGSKAPPHTCVVSKEVGPTPK